MSISDFDQGWIIGFIEGEGSFTYDTQGGRPRKNGERRIIPRLFVTQTNSVPLEFIKEFFGGGHIYERYYKEKEYGRNKSRRWDYIVVDIETLIRVRDFCDGRLKHPLKVIQFEKWKKLFDNHYGKEGQRELARVQMNGRWKDPDYKLKIQNGAKKRWTKEAKIAQREKLINTWAELKAKGKSKLEVLL